MSSSKLILHERLCSQLTTMCEICEEYVDIEDMEDHNKENHEKTKCFDCGKIFEKIQVQSHKKKCTSRKVECMYCELTLTKDELHDHEYICGSKTEPCDKCGELVMKVGNYRLTIEYDLHLSINCKKESIDDAIGKKRTYDEYERNARHSKPSKAENEYNIENFSNNVNQTKNTKNKKASKKLVKPNKRAEDFFSKVSQNFYSGPKSYIKNLSSETVDHTVSPKTKSEIHKLMQTDSQLEAPISAIDEEEVDQDLMFAVLEMSKKNK